MLIDIINFKQMQSSFFFLFWWYTLWNCTPHFENGLSRLSKAWPCRALCLFGSLIQGGLIGGQRV